MVFPDLSAPEIKFRQSPTKKLTPIASVTDRFVALILDFLIFSPVISLFLAGIVRNAKISFLINSSSQEGLIAFGLGVSLCLFLVILLQTSFLYFLQATPGQIFLQLKVISYPDSKPRLDFNQCFLRSFMWCTGFVFLGIPYLEIVGHPLRRAFHERASDTLVVTLKKNFDRGPFPLETNFIASWLRMCFLFLILLGSLGFLKTYRALKLGHYAKAGNPGSHCKELLTAEPVSASRMDMAVTLFLLGEISPQCLNQEADANLWNGEYLNHEMSYLAKALASDSEPDQDKYFKKICENINSSACIMARYLREEGPKDLQFADQKLLISQLLLSEEKYFEKDFRASIKIIETMQKEPALKAALEKRYVRSIWSLNETNKLLKKQQGRFPSSDDSEILNSFKEKYEVE